MRRLLVLFFVAVVLANAQAPIGPGTPYLSHFADYAIALATQQGGTFVQVGSYLLALALAFGLVKIGIGGVLKSMAGYHAMPIDVAGLVWLMVRSIVASLILLYWAQPIPGAGVTLGELIPIVFSNLAANLDQSIIQQFLITGANVFASLQRPSFLNILGVVIYALVLLSVALMLAPVFIIETFAYFGIDVFVIFGPLTVFGLLTETQRFRFFNVLDNLVVYSAYRLVGSIAFYLYCHVIMDFFNNSVAGDYSIGHFIALLIPAAALAGGMIYAAFHIPSVARSLCGGSSIGDMGERFYSSAQEVVQEGTKWTLAALAG